MQYVGWFETINLLRWILCQNSFSDCALFWVARLLCQLYSKSRYTQIYSCYVLVFCKRTFSFIFWITKLGKSEQTSVSHVSIDLNKTAFYCIFIDYLDLMKKSETSELIFMSMTFNYWTKSTKVFHSCFFMGYLINVFIFWRS